MNSWRQKSAVRMSVVKILLADQYRGNNKLSEQKSIRQSITRGTGKKALDKQA